MNRNDIDSTAASDEQRYSNSPAVMAHHGRPTTAAASSQCSHPHPLPNTAATTAPDTAVVAMRDVSVPAVVAITTSDGHEKEEKEALPHDPFATTTAAKSAHDNSGNSSTIVAAASTPDHRTVFADACVLDGTGGGDAEKHTILPLSIQSLHPDTTHNTTLDSSNDDSSKVLPLFKVAETTETPRLSDDTQRRRKKRMCWLGLGGVLLVALVGAAIAVGVGTICRNSDWRCSSSTASPRHDSTSPVGTTGTGTVVDRAEAMGAYINSITLSGRTIAVLLQSGGDAISRHELAEERALQWLIYNDPLQLEIPVIVSSTSSLVPTHNSRLQQRYALRTLFEQIEASNTKGDEDGAENVTEWPLLSIQNATAALDECEWLGITCQAVHDNDGIESDEARVVTEIKLADTNLSGTLAADLGLLSALVLLDVSRNALSGTLTEGLGAWTDLQVFDIGYNLGFTGSIPTSLARWTALKHFMAAENGLTGSLPTELGEWSLLEHFNVNGNSLDGTLPEELSQWTNIKHFVIGDNALVGSLPVSLGQWTNLLYFDAGSTASRDVLNRMTGTLPDTLGQWTALKSFNVSWNRFTGELPESLGNWTVLEVFDIHEINTITGTLSPSFAQWTNIREFTVNSNALEGSLPDSFAAWTNLELFDVNDNSFTGPLSEAYSQWTNLWYFDIQFNKISETIPPEFGQWSNLIYLTASVNLLTGSLPHSIGNWTNLLAFSVSDNDLTGSLPDSIGRWKNMSEFFIVDRNALNGTLSESIGQWSQLFLFSVAANALTGTVPASIESWTNIDTIYLEANDFVGSIPDALCDTNVSILAADCPSEVTCQCCTACDLTLDRNYPYL